MEDKGNKWIVTLGTAAIIGLIVVSFFILVMIYSIYKKLRDAPVTTTSNYFAEDIYDDWRSWPSEGTDIENAFQQSKIEEGEWGILEAFQVGDRRGFQSAPRSNQRATVSVISAPYAPSPNVIVPNDYYADSPYTTAKEHLGYFALNQDGTLPLTAQYNIEAKMIGGAEEFPTYSRPGDWKERVSATME